jgi:hypothetical protein
MLNELPARALIPRRIGRQGRTTVASDKETTGQTRARPKLADLRAILDEAREMDDAERIHVALIEIVDGLITHAEVQAKMMDDMASDLGHKQGIVTKIGGGDFKR